MKQNWAAYSIPNVPENLSAKRNQISEDIFIPEEEKKKKKFTMSFQNTAIFQKFSQLNHFQLCRPDVIGEGEKMQGNVMLASFEWSTIAEDIHHLKSLPQHSSPTALQTLLVLVDIGNCYIQLLMLLYKVLCNCTLVILTVFLCPLAVWVSHCITSWCCFWSKAVKLQNAPEMFVYLRWLWWVYLTFNTSLWIQNLGPSREYSSTAVIN